MQPTDRCDASNPGKAVETSPLCDQARQMAFAKPDGAERQVLAQADKLILSVPATTLHAAHSGVDSAQIMSLGYRHADHGSAISPPELNAGQKKVFDALAAKGLNPTIEAEYFRTDGHAPSEKSWVLKANWKDGQTGDPELKQETSEARKRIEMQSAHKQLEDAHQQTLNTDLVLAKLPGSLREAAQNGKDYDDVMSVGWRYSGSNKPNLTDLNNNQQRVFDALKAQGLNPSISEGNDGSHSAWMIRANWKDGENPDATLSRLTKEARVRTQENAEFETQQRRQDLMEIADERIATIPFLIKQAQDNNNDFATIMKIGRAYSSHDLKTQSPPELSQSQQKVFDALLTQNLKPTEDKEYYRDSDSMFGEESWVLRAHWKN